MLLLHCQYYIDDMGNHSVRMSQRNTRMM